MNAYCQIEHVSSDSDVGMPCGKPAVAECAQCAEWNVVGVIKS